MPKQRLDSLQTVLEIADPGEFLSALAGLDEKHNGMEFHARPDLLGMLGGLYALYVDVQLDGIWKFLAQSEGRGFHQTEAWVRRINAEKMTAYLAEVAALSPGGRVPEDDEARYEVVQEYERQKTAVDPTDALEKLDRKYKGAIDEMAERLRTYVREHQADFEQALAAPAQRGGSAESWTKLAKGALALLKAMVQSSKDDVAARKLLAEQRGLRQPDGSEDPRMTRFMDALRPLTRDHWLAICRRSVAAPRDANLAREEVASLIADLVTGRLMGDKAGKVLMDTAMRVRDRTAPVLSALAESVEVDGAAFPLKRAAVAATLGAWQTLMLYDWLAVTEEGARAARTLLAPFDGFAPMP